MNTYSKEEMAAIAENMRWLKLKYEFNEAVAHYFEEQSRTSAKDLTSKQRAVRVLI